MIIGSRPADIYGGPGGDTSSPDPWQYLAEDIVTAAIEAVKNGELGAEDFFFSRYGENLIIGLGGDPEFIRLLLQREHTMSQSNLSKVVQDLKRRAMDTPREPARAHLNGGLSLVLIYELTHWRLSMTRPKVEASKAEIATCRALFEIPEEIKPERSSQDQNGETYFVLRFYWPSAVQLNFVEEDGTMLAFTKRESYYDEAA